MGNNSGRLTMAAPEMIGRHEYMETSIEFFVGSITDIEAGVVVVSSNETFSMDVGAARAIVNTGGSEFTEALYVAKLFHNTGHLSIDCSMVESLKVRKVLVIPLKHRNRRSMRTVYREALKAVIDSGEIIAVMPLIGCGGYNLPKSVACREMCEAISSFTTLRQIRQLKFVDLSHRTMEELYNACGDLVGLGIPDLASQFGAPSDYGMYDIHGMSSQSLLPMQHQGLSSLVSGDDDEIQVVSSVVNPRSSSSSEIVVLDERFPRPVQLHNDEILYVGVTRPMRDLDETMSSATLTKIYSEIERNTISDPECCCSICLNELVSSGGEGFENNLKEDPVVQMKLCIHQFHKSCINKCLNIKKQCPLCMKWYTPSLGTQPKDSKMRVKRLPGNPPGHLDADGWFKITYTIPSGIQGPNHIRPGLPYSGTTRSAYIPNDTEGKQVLQLLKKAFEYRHTFTIGDSITTGRCNVPVMVIHHKTNMNGGPLNYGYPDPDYYGRVKSELEQLGITPAMLNN